MINSLIYIKLIYIYIAEYVSAQLYINMLIQMYIEHYTSSYHGMNTEIERRNCIHCVQCGVHAWQRAGQ